jgi:hypothetical protein
VTGREDVGVSSSVGEVSGSAWLAVEALHVSIPPSVTVGRVAGRGREVPLLITSPS